MTVEEFEDFLGEVVQNVEELDNNLVPLINQIVQELKNAAPVAAEDGGQLRDSIKAIIVGDAVTFSFLDYGLYQNFGVNGTKQNSGAFGLTASFDDAGRVFSFKKETIGGKLPFGVRKSIAEKGIKPQRWFNFEIIKDRIIAEIERLAQQNIQ